MGEVQYPPEFRLNPEQLLSVLSSVTIDPAIPTVVNRHWYRKKRMPEEARYIGRGTPLGNPYTLHEHGDGAMDLYCVWLIDKLRTNNTKVVDELRAITSETLLMCSCKPRPCHGDVVVGCWVWMLVRGMIPRI